MEQLKTMLTSSTNWYVFILISVLCWINVYSLLHYPDTLFEKVFVVFTNILSGYAGYQYGYGKNKPIIPEKKIDDFQV